MPFTLLPCEPYISSAASLRGSDYEVLTFAGECFQGGASANRVDEIQEDAGLDLVSHSWFQGLKGYVSYRSSDHSQFLCLVVPRSRSLGAVSELFKGSEEAFKRL